MIAVIGRTADEAHAEGPHESGDGRPDDLTAEELFKGPQHGVVVEGTALDDDVFAQFFRVFYLYYFI